MTHLTKDNSVTSDALLIQDDLCEVCAKKDEEDLYIVFNILYRIVIGDNFYKGSEVSRECFDLDLLSSEIIQTKEKDCRISLERLQEFRNNLSSQTLIELMALQKFDLLLREIFKPKYIKIQDATCKHTQLAVTFIRNFNLKNKEAFENSESERNQFIQIVEKMDSLYNKVKKLKSEIESCHNEIDGLSESIIKKLFPNRSHMVGKKEEKSEEDESDYEDPNSEMYDSVQKKIFMNPKTSSGSVSTAVSREISGGRSSSASSNSDKLAEVISTENQSLNQKKIKSVTFKCKLPKRATDILKNWFLNNINNPYPAHEAKEALSKATGLTIKQIQNWFTNSRKRFLEPLKKKLESQKQSKDNNNTISCDKEQDVFISECQSQVDQTEQPLSQTVMQEPSVSTSIQVQPQQNLKQPFIMNMPPQPMVEPVPIKPVEVQKVTPQYTLQLQQPVYSTIVPQPPAQSGSNVIFVPWIIPQPMFSYRPGYPNVLPMNTPQFVPLQQTTPYPNNYPSVGNLPMMSNPYILSMPTNFMDPTRIVNQQVPAAPFIPINPNSYNGINYPDNSAQSIITSQDRIPYITKVSPFGNPVNPNPGQPIYTPIPDGFQRNPLELYNIKPESQR